MTDLDRALELAKEFTTSAEQVNVETGDMLYLFARALLALAAQLPTAEEREDLRHTRILILDRMCRCTSCVRQVATLDRLIGTVAS